MKEHQSVENFDYVFSFLILIELHNKEIPRQFLIVFSRVSSQRFWSFFVPETVFSSVPSQSTLESH